METRIQVRIIVGSSRSAQYRVRLANGQWSKAWHHMTVKDALAAQRTGRAHVGGLENCIVEIA